MPLFSILDSVPVPQGVAIGAALSRSLAAAQLAERLKYHRYWFTEQHSTIGAASSATAVMVGHIAAATRSIRVGAGGIMLPNHAPLAIAEQFGTLETLFSGRIDLGIGRASGTDAQTANALRRGFQKDETSFAQDVEELRGYFEGGRNRAVHAIPGAGINVPIWLLGSGLFSARLAGVLGLPFAFAYHFSPDRLDEALAVYRRHFSPSRDLHKPYIIVSVPFYAAETNEDADFIITSVQQSFVDRRRGRPGELPPPQAPASIRQTWSADEQATVMRAFQHAFVGSGATIMTRMEALIERTRADEIMITMSLYEWQARVKAMVIASEVRDYLQAVL